MPSPPFLLETAAQHIISRLDFIKLIPAQVLLFGGGQAYHQAFTAHYPEAQFTECHEFSALPAGQVDAVFASLPTGVDDTSLRALADCVRREGLLMLHLLGPDSLRELPALAAHCGVPLSMPTFPDMHDVGDSLLKLGLSDPVMDVETLTLVYEDLALLGQDLAGLGLSIEALSGPIPEALQDEAGHFSLTLEMVYAHAWGADVTGNRPNEAGEVHISIRHLRNRLRS